MHDDGAIHVLLVDDEPDVAAVTADMLGQRSDRITVETVHSAETALDCLPDTDIDCIVSDYQMAAMDGIAFLRAVRDEHPDLPFILYTGEGSEEVASDAISAGVTDYLQKEASTDHYELLATRIENAVARTRAQQARRRQLNAIETAQEGIGILNADGEFVYVNDAYADLYGYDREELLGEHWELLYVDSDVEEIHSEILPTVEAEGYWRGETTGLRADGTTFVEDHSLAMTDDGELVCTVRDITARREHEQELERFKTIVEATGDPVLVLDADGEITYVNNALVELTGYDQDRLIGANPSLFVPADDVAQSEAVIRSLLADEPDRTRETFELTVTTANGEEIPCENHIALLPFDEEFRGTVGVFRDISERTRWETGLSALQDATRDLIDAPDTQTVADRAVETAQTVLHLPIGALWLYDKDADVLRPAATTDAATELLGEHPAYTRGESLSWQAFEDGELRVYEDVHTSEERYRADTPIHSELIVPLGEYGVMNFGATTPQTFSEVDISLARTLCKTVEAALDRADREARLREQQAELERQNDRLEQFASVVSHDLRNPLNVAQGRVGLAQEECDSDHLAAVVRAHDRMETLIDNLLTLARTGTQVEDTEPVDLAAIAHGSWGTVATAEATLVTDTDQTIQADRSRLTQLLENLFRNAVEHGGADVTVTVGDLADGDGTGNGFYVADDGPGIPADEQEDVFEAGYSTADDGTGLGLNIVQEIAEAHGWRVAVTDSATGGARIEITGLTSSHP